MRRLLLLRHAKAAPSAGGDDFNRTLAERGREDAKHIGDIMAEKDLVPDLVVYSSAERTRQTAHAVASRWPRPVKSIAEKGLYEASPESIFLRLRSLPDTAGVAMVVGHNPGIGDIANLLTGGGAKDDRTRMAVKFPTSGLAVLDFPCERWADIEPHTARLVRFVTPADLSSRRA